MEHLKEVCLQTHLGEWITVPVKVSGGLLHTMYAVETTKGKYAVKALNPSIMKRPDALGNYIRSEQVARLVCKNVPALPAKTFEGNAIQKVGDQWFLVFDWVEGRSVKQDEIGIDHCRKIGSVLADIHHTDFQELRIEPEETEVRPSVDWNAYLKKGQVMEAEWVKSFKDIIENLYEWDAGAREAEPRLGNDRVMSHRDLDPKNVIWVQGEPVVIDWESAGFIHPMHDLIETALYWSGATNQDRFSAFTSGYKGENGAITADWEAVLANGFSGKLGWLEYNLKRSLWLECTDEEEQRLGIRQVIETIGELREYANRIPELLKGLKSG
ncbi:phosphotransferase [Bacillus sp. es.034]|uniref:phosphotransferase n=1 Tax=Bacillus sp. es.034 TaxID=1761763 RepID=UPI000BF6AE19|nr:phosphotransferase [Bacillus sp. es.034]PFG03507.1 Ser/Thr protein kinase RdoA (MazF antagonist) [Bacillus sp. es.034]